MIKNDDLWNKACDISETTRRAGIPYPAFATRALLERYAGVEQQTHEDPLCLWDLVWMVRAALSGVVECPRFASESHQTYHIEFFSFVRGNPEAELVQIHAVLRQDSKGEKVLLLKLVHESQASGQMV